MNENIAKAFVKAQQAFGPALKTATNPHYKSRYADLSACVEAVIDSLNANGIALIQNTHESDSGVTVETIFMHESGETISSGKLHVPAAKNDPQGYGSALTYARRYSLMAACGIAPEDDDGNAASRSAPRTAAIKPKGTITPNSGALDNITPERLEQLKEIAASVVDFAEKGQWDDAYITYDEIEDNEDRLAVWALLAPNSSIRSRLKKMADERKQPQKEAA